MRFIKKQFPILVLVFLLTFLIFYSEGRAETITIAADEWCPYNCKPDSDRPGFMIEIAKEVFEKNGHNVVYKVMSWDKAIEFAKNGYVYALVGATKEEVRGFYFPSVSQGVSLSYFYVKNTTTWNYDGVDSLKGKKIGFIEGYSYGDEIDKYIEENRGTSAVRIESGNEALDKLVEVLMDRKIDAIAEDRQVLSYHMKEIGKVAALRNAGAINVIPKPDEDYLYIAFTTKRAKSKEFAEMLSEGTKELRKSGRLKEILDKYGLEDWDKTL